MVEQPDIKIYGLQKLSLIDYPGKIACTIFLSGCNWCCPFCHNARVVFERPGGDTEMSEILAFLKKRKRILEGVCISGGEPLLQKDLRYFIQNLKKNGYAVKLDTNGSFPDRLKELICNNLIDYVAMDIKNSPDHYAQTTGCSFMDISPIMESAEFLLAGNIAYEFRTTVVKELHSIEDIRNIGRWLEGAEKYFLQTFVDSGDVLQPGLHSCLKDEMDLFLRVIQQYIPAAMLR